MRIVLTPCDPVYGLPAVLHVPAAQSGLTGALQLDRVRVGKGRVAHLTVTSVHPAVLRAGLLQDRENGSPLLCGLPTDASFPAPPPRLTELLVEQLPQVGF